MLLTYTDAFDPAHSFQQPVTVDNTGHVVVTPEGGVTIVQLNDPALVTFEYLSNPGANISRATLEGESFNVGAMTGRTSCTPMPRCLIRHSSTPRQ
ncbi:MAG TPA: hypothetical protein VGR52_11245 [Stellaceae bacterium]|nr:hypothetical protein [Stellaceae bacterium]